MSKYITPSGKAPMKPARNCNFPYPNSPAG
jgi:hypothetical protein